MKDRGNTISPNSIGLVAKGVQVLENMIANQLKNFAGKELSIKQKDRVLDAPACKNPLFLPKLFLGPRSPSDHFKKKL